MGAVTREIALQQMAQEADLAATTFGPLEKYVAANDNVPQMERDVAAVQDPRPDFGKVIGEVVLYPQPQDESGASAGFGVSNQNVGRGLPTTILRVPMPPVQPPRPRTGDFMQVYSGRQFWPLDPRAEEIHIEDIAHSLSLQCRYAGHCIRFYSVAEHSVHVARWLLKQYGPLTALHGLLHDASEAYLIDVPRPLKPFLPGYKQAEERVMVAVAERFSLNLGMPAVVKEADDRIIADELVNLRPMEWHKKHDDPLGVRIGCWSPDAAEDEFLATYVMLCGRLGRTKGSGKGRVAV